MRNCNVRIESEGDIDKYFLHNSDIFPNSRLPVLHYKQVFKIPALFPGRKAKKMLQQNGWTNNWNAGIFPYQHYHSNTHEAMVAINGQTMLLLGGENGAIITFKKGDVLVIPAGVAHKNLGKEFSITCIGGYPDGIEYDIKYGSPGERPAADRNISEVNIPRTGPLCGDEDPLMDIWNASEMIPEINRLKAV
jgi:uncharacterized protein YjlB